MNKAAIYHRPESEYAFYIQQMNYGYVSEQPKK